MHYDYTDRERWGSGPGAARSLTILRVIPATAVAANMLNLLAYMTVNHEGHIAVGRCGGSRGAGGVFLVTEGLHLHQIKRLLLRLLHCRAVPVAGGEPGAVHDATRRIRHGVARGLQHESGQADRRPAARSCGSGKVIRRDSPRLTPL